MLAPDAMRPRPLGGAGSRDADRLGGAITITDSTTATAAVAPDRTAYLLAELRCAALRARLVAADIDTIGIALRGGMIDADAAAEALADCGALQYVGVGP